MGRKALEFNDLQKAQVEALAAYLTLEQIADYFGICRKTLQNMRHRDAEIDTLHRDRDWETSGQRFHLRFL